jgi:hypothetical protein
MNSLRDLGIRFPLRQINPSRFKPEYGKYTTLLLIGIARDCQIRATGIEFP